MSQGSSGGEIAQPLNIGNVVTAGFRLYRSHLKLYFLIALRSQAWQWLPAWVLLPIGLVVATIAPDNPSPEDFIGLILLSTVLGAGLFIFGSMKFLVNSAQISRLAFGDLVEQPESPRMASQQVNARMWRFLGMGFLMWLIRTLATTAFVVVVGLFIVLLAIVATLVTGTSFQMLDRDPATAFVVLAILVIGGVAVFLAAMIPLGWFLLRFFIVEVPLAIEDNIGPADTIGRSWTLTKGNVIRLFVIALVGFAITVPIQFAIQLFSNILQLIVSVAVPGFENPTLAMAPVLILFFLVIFGLFIVSNALVLPFWQTLKAAAYYDLRSRREGLGLQLRDREI